MKIAKITILSAFLLNVLLLPQPGTASKPAPSTCEEVLRPMRVTARHIESGGIGYHQGYTTVEGFFPLYNGWDNWVLFLDTRVHVFNSGRPALNAGVGTRYLTESRLWGLNTYYDYRKTRRQHYNQVAMGCESLGEVWDFRLNGYVPVGKTISPHYNKQFAYFQGNNAILRERYEFALAGFNGEVGAHVNKWEKYPLYFSAGPYYLTGKGATTWGGEARASVRVYEYLTLEGYTSYDHLFKWTGQGQIGLSFSFGGKKEIKPKNSSQSCSQSFAIASRAYQSVDRFEIMPVDKKNHHSTAINPLTGDPYSFWFVNNTSHCNGTIESPCNTLVPVSTDVIYVFSGDGTSTGMSSGIALKNNQRLWGSVVAQNLPTTIGNISIPAQSSGTLGTTVIAPLLSNGSGNVVTLANNNEVSGFFLENTGSSYSISGTNVTNATVLNCTLAGSNAQGEIGISTSELAGTLTIDNCVFTQNYGLSLSNSSTNLQVSVSNSSFSGGTGTTSSIAWTLSSGSQSTLTANNNTFNSYYSGITITSANTSTLTANINNSTITAAGYGLSLTTSATTATHTLFMNGSTIVANLPAIYLNETGNWSASFVNNTISSSEYAIGAAMSSGNGSIFAQNNLINAFYDYYAIYFDQSGGSLSATFTDNEIASVEENAIYSTLTGSASTHSLNMTSNKVTGYQGWDLNQTVGTVTSTWTNNTVSAEEYGLSINEIDTATSTSITCTGNTFQAEYGVYLDQSIGTCSFTLNNNLIQTINDEGAVYLEITGGTNSTISMTGNQINGYYGVYYDQTAGTVNLTMDNNQVVGTYGLYADPIDSTATFTLTGNTYIAAQPLYLVQNAGTFNPTITDNTMTSAGNTAVTYISTSTAASTQTFSGNTISASGSGANAVSMTLEGSGEIQTTMTNNTFSSSSSVAVSSSLSSSGTQVLTLSDNTLTTSGGYSLAASNTSNATWKVNDNQFAASNTTPITATAANTSTVCMQLNNNTAYPITGAYVLDNTGSGTFTLNTPTGNIGALSTTNITTGSCP